MVSRIPERARPAGGYMAADLMVAIALLLLAAVPLAFSFAQEQKLARACYVRAIAAEIVDGELEVLLAGAWRQCPAGTHPYTVSARSAANLPAGGFWLTVETNRLLRLEWRPEGRPRTTWITREGTPP